MARVLFVGRPAARPVRLPAMRVEAVQVHVRRGVTSAQERGGVQVALGDLRWPFRWQFMGPEWQEKLQRLTAVVCFLLIEKAMVATGLTVYLPGTLLGMFSLFAFLLTLDATGFQKTAMGCWSALPCLSLPLTCQLILYISYYIACKRPQYHGVQHTNTTICLTYFLYYSFILIHLLHVFLDVHVDSYRRQGSSRGLFRFLEPGYRFLLKWAPVFFTPALVKLPLVEDPISGFEFARVALMIFLGGMLQCPEAWEGKGMSFGARKSLADSTKGGWN